MVPGCPLKILGGGLMKTLAKFTLALIVVASLLPISEANAGRRHRRRGCNSCNTCNTGCYTNTCGPNGCQVYLGK